MNCKKFYLPNLSIVRKSTIKDGKKITQTDIAQLLQVTKGTICMIEKSQLPVKESEALKICDFLNCKLDDLKKERTSNIYYNNSIINQHQNNCTNYDSTQAQQEQDSDKEATIRYLLNKPTQSVKDIDIITAGTDTMFPTIEKSDILLIDKTQTINSINETKQIYLIKNNNGDCFLRAIKKNIIGKFEIFADNKEYSDTNVSVDKLEDNFEIVGKIVYKITKM